MYQFDRFLMVDQFSKSGHQNGRTIYKATLEGQHLIDINKPTLLIENGRGIVDVVVPYELHITEYGTTVFFTKMSESERLFNSKDLQTLWRYVMAVDGGSINSPTPGYRTDSDTAATGMDAATRMMMGQDRSARQIARGERDDDRGPSLSDMMRMSNPGGFDDNDPYSGW